MKSELNDTIFTSISYALHRNPNHAEEVRAGVDVALRLNGGNPAPTRRGDNAVGREEGDTELQIIANQTGKEIHTSKDGSEKVKVFIPTTGHDGSVIVLANDRPGEFTFVRVAEAATVSRVALVKRSLYAPVTIEGKTYLWLVDTGAEVSMLRLGVLKNETPPTRKQHSNGAC